jgi:hypothetical protein
LHRIQRRRLKRAEHLRHLLAQREEAFEVGAYSGARGEEQVKHQRVALAHALLADLLDGDSHVRRHLLAILGHLLQQTDALLQRDVNIQQRLVQPLLPASRSLGALQALRYAVRRGRCGRPRHRASLSAREKAEHLLWMQDGWYAR